jgi:hypothetical protein
MLVRYVRCYWTLAINTVLLALLILLDGAACAEPARIETGLIQGMVGDGLSIYRGIPYAAPHSDEMTLVFQQFGLPAWPAYENAKPQAMHFVSGKARAGPVVNEEGVRALDAYFEWRRTSDAHTPAGGIPAKQGIFGEPDAALDVDARRL